MHRNALAGVMTVVLAACSATPVLDATGPGPGWRKGVVVQVGDRDSLGPPVDSDCRLREDANAGSNEKRRYVEVQYFVGRHAHLRIVPIDDGTRVAAGDPVFFRSFGCVAARVAGP